MKIRISWYRTSYLDDFTNLVITLQRFHQPGLQIKLAKVCFSFTQQTSLWGLEVWDNVIIDCTRGSEDPNSGDPLVALRAFQMAQSKQFRKPVCFPPAYYHHIHQQLLGSQLSSLHWSQLKMKPFFYFPLSLSQVQSSTESLGSALKMIKKRRSLFEHGDYHD